MVSYYIAIVHGGSVFEISRVFAYTSLGILVGIIVFEIRKYWNPVKLFFFLSMFLIFLGDLVFVLAPYRSFGLIFLTRFVKGFCLVFIYTMITTFIQSNVPKNKLGRVSSIYFTITSLVTVFASFQLNGLLLLFSDVGFILFLNSLFGIISVIALYIVTRIIKLKFVNYKALDNIEYNKSS